jgi:hypothetical protein
MLQRFILFIFMVGCGPLIPPPAAIPFDGTRAQPEGTNTVSSYGGSLATDVGGVNWFGAQTTYQLSPKLSLGGTRTRGGDGVEIIQQERLHLRYNPGSDHFAFTVGAGGGFNSAILYGALVAGIQGAIFVGPRRGLELHTAFSLSHSAELLRVDKEDFDHVSWSVASFGLLGDISEHLRVGADVVLFGLLQPLDSEHEPGDFLKSFAAFPSVCLSFGYRNIPKTQSFAALQ